MTESACGATSRYGLVVQLNTTDRGVLVDMDLFVLTFPDTRAKLNITDYYRCFTANSWNRLSRSHPIVLVRPPQVNSFA
jgi:hypothetical protein